MSALAQNPTGDIQVANNRLAVVVDYPTLTAMRLQNRFRLFLGEWFLNRNEGIPYFQALFAKTDLTTASQFFRTIILKTPGVAEILSLNLTFDPATRHLDVAFRVRDDSGATIVGGRGEPFIVEST